MLRMQNKVAIVTGAGQGVGEGIATAFAKAGASVVLAGRTLSKVQHVADALTAQSLAAVAVECDVACRDDVDNLVKFTAEKFGGIDVLVNNAGTAYDTRLPIEGTTTEFFQQGVDINLLGTLWCMQAALPYLKVRRGNVINLASEAGLEGVAYLATYAATKEGVRALTRTAAKEWGPFGINVNVICPFASSPAWQSIEKEYPEKFQKVLSEIPLGYIGDCEKDIGPVAVFLATEDSRYITGHTIMVDGGHEVLR